jgi:hypothetical protein
MLAIAASLVGCAGTIEDPALFTSNSADPTGAPPPTATTSSGCGDPTTSIFPASCAASACHGSSSPQAGLDLASPGLPGRLVGKMASGGPGFLIDPSGDPDKSILYSKLTATPPYGLQMPMVGPKLDDTEMACMRAWISSSVGGAGIDAGSSD